MYKNCGLVVAILRPRKPIGIVCVLRHRVIENNRRAGECAVSGLSLDDTMACWDVQTPSVSLANKINNWTLIENTTWRYTVETFRILKKLWVYRSRERTKNLLSFVKVSIRLLVGIIMYNWKYFLGIYSFWDLECLRDFESLRFDRK